MRYSALLCAAALAACAKTEQKPDTTTPAAATPTPAVAPMPAPGPTISLADVAGTWEGQVRPVDKDTVVTTLELIATSTTDGWSMKLPNGAKPAVKVTSVAGDSIVMDAGPFASVLRKGQQVTTHSVYRLQGGKLVGMTYAKYANGDSAALRVEATKKAGK